MEMIEYFTVSMQEGKEYAIKLAHILEKKGYEILDIEKGLVPRGENADGMLYYAPGYKITVDNGKSPRYRGKWFSELPVVIDDSEGKLDKIPAVVNKDDDQPDESVITVNENLIDPPGVESDSRWLWE